jgi:DNA topoisomerase-3
MNENDEYALVPKTPAAIEKVAPGAKRVLSGMVEDTLALTKIKSLGLCPKCGGKVFEEQKKFICEKSRAKTNSCKFFFSKNIFQQPIDAIQMRKLLEFGKTDLLDKFISKSGKRYSAYLVISDGKVIFEFPT